MVTLKAASANDGILLAKLMRDTFKDAYREVHSAEDIKEYCGRVYADGRIHTELSDQAAVIKIAFMGETPVGFYQLVKKACPLDAREPAYELKRIYVLASQYGRGTGKLLYEDVIKTCKTRDAALMWLAVADNNKRAQTFYQKQGLVIVGAGEVIPVGSDSLTSSILICDLHNIN